jgi:hypothetical protein
VARERNTAADNGRGLRDPLLATVAALLLGAVWHVSHSHMRAVALPRASGGALTPAPAAPPR